VVAGEAEFLELVLQNANNRVILERAGRLGVPDWWLTAGAVFQSVWNGLTWRHANAGILDYDLFYFDRDDLSAASEQRVQCDATRLFDDLDVVVEVRNEARVHLWCEDEFGVPGRRFTSSKDAIDHFAATTCSFAITCRDDATFEIYAPHGFTDLLSRRVRPNPMLAPATSTRQRRAAGASNGPRSTSSPGPTKRHKPASARSPTRPSRSDYCFSRQPVRGRAPARRALIREPRSLGCGVWSCSDSR
jgi:hypothetical protein